jgi:hypothetical protein
MFGLRFPSDSQNLRKNGQPPHSTTGVASANSRYANLSCGAANIGAMAITRSGTLSAALTHSLRVKSRSSESSSAAPSIGTSAMPHFGHDPGPTCTTSGCIGQVYFAPGFSGVAPFAFPARNFSGFALKACMQCCEQKW